MVEIVNLEQPISDSYFVEGKCTLYTGSFAIRILQDLKANAVNLAHSHIQDKGLAGITETVYRLDDAKIGCFGAGENINYAKNHIG